MTRNNLLVLFLILSFNFSKAQDFGGVKDAKDKIENTVPILMEFLENKAKEYGEDANLELSKASLQKEYARVASEYSVYLTNISDCILDNRSKKYKKCMNYNSKYFKNTLNNYDTYMIYMTRQNGVESKEIKEKLNFNPSDIISRIDKEYLNTAGRLGKMKGSDRQNLAESLKSSEFKIKPFNEVATK